MTTGFNDARPVAPKDITDIAMIDPSDLMIPMRHLISNGRGLALLNGLSDADLRALDCIIWQQFSDRPLVRVAVAVRFRALIDVFGARRLRELLLQRGFKLIASAVELAASQRLNPRFGFKSHAFVVALGRENGPLRVQPIASSPTQLAA